LKRKFYYIQNKILIAKQLKKYALKNQGTIRVYKKDYYQKHKEKSSEQHKEQYLKNKEKIKQRITKYRKLHKKERNLYEKNKRETDINYKIEVCLRGRIRKALKGINKSKSTMKLLGCSLEFFKSYYESKFTKGMSWAKVMNGEIHCDHIRPCASFDLSKPEEQKKCFHYTNLQPLWAKENLSKGDKINE
jgi:hypothetical protein